MDREGQGETSLVLRLASLLRRRLLNFGLIKLPLVVFRCLNILQQITQEIFRRH